MMPVEKRSVWFMGEMVEMEADWGAPPEHVPDPSPFRSVAMWRARAIMKITPWGDGTLWDAVLAAIEQLPDQVERVIAYEALNGSGDYDRDGVFVPRLAAIVGIDDTTHDQFMKDAAALPA